MNRDVVIGKYTLESLTNGMYADPLDLYREYIQNSADSIDNDKQTCGMSCEYRIEVNIDELSGSISIRDNGTGIREKIAVPTLVDIGNSDKDKNKTRGFRGIGRLAGLGYCDELVFVTSSRGECSRTLICFDTKQLKILLFNDDQSVISINDVMKKIITVSYEEEESDCHFFEVRLEGVSNNVKLLNLDIVEKYLIQHVPVPYRREFMWASTIREKCKLLGYDIPEYNITLNGKQLFKPYANTFLCDRVKKREDSIRDIEVVPFYRDENLVAVLWYGSVGFYGTILDNQIKGIRIRQGNLLIGDKTTCNRLFKEERFNGWMIGELHVVDPEMIVNARRDYFEQNEAHYNLSEDFIEWSTQKIKEIRKLSYSRTLSEKEIQFIDSDSAEDVNNLSVETIDMDPSESDYIDSEENEEVSEIDFLNKLSRMMNQKQTKYMALNIKDHLSVEQKKIVEKIFDILTGNYNEEAEAIINLILDQL
ncbi:MAG: ATP-binding protein [Erysipelotrichaceae bacterium]|nr:ATP-binding protein [Erysipelotrichaceae bacterium]